MPGKEIAEGMHEKIDKQNVEDILPITSLQSGMLFHYLHEDESDLYIVQLGLGLSGKVYGDLIKKAWHCVVQNNEVLRSVFRWDKLSSPVQIIFKTYNTPIREIDLTQARAVDKEALLEEIIINDRKEKVDIAVAPCRLTLVKQDVDLYKMIITSHHILFDGWSNGVILQEFIKTYGDLLNGEVPKLLVKTHYREYIQWHKSQDEEKALKYWQQYLENYGTITQLPYDSVKKDGIRKVDNYTTRLKGGMSEDIQRFLQNNRITLASLFFSAWGILLQKYSGTNDVVFGSTVSVRNPEIRNIQAMVGLCINTLPIRIKSAPEESLDSMLNRVQNIITENIEFSSTSLTKIKSCSKVSCEENFFDSIVIIENYPIDKSLKADGDIRIQSVFVREMTNFDLVLQVITIMDDIELRIGYNAEVFEYATVQNFVDHFVNILKNILKSTSRRIADVDMLSDEEKNKIIYDFNNTDIDYPRDITMVQLFEEQVERTPDNISLVFENHELTYREINEKANQLARVLKDKKDNTTIMEKDEIVAIVVQRSMEMVISILAVLKAGMAYLPIDPEYPPDRIAYMLDDSKAGLLLTQTHLMGKFEFNGSTIFVDNESVYAQIYENLSVNNLYSQLAYVIYTSGSTGKPKGVMIRQKSLCNFIKGVTDKIDFSQSKSIVALTTISFDIFVLETLLPLTKGMRVVIANESEQRDPQLLSALIAQNNVDMLQITPSRLQMLMNGTDIDLCFKNLKEIMVGGEAFPPALLYNLQKVTHAKIYNMYGPTETTVWSTIKEFNDTKTVDIGKPIANTQVYILDKYNNIQPIKVIGELCIAGEGLARGYINMQSLTEEKFVPIQLNGVKESNWIGKKMYRTGDLARWLPDGNIECFGRIDHQVKIRGFRVELQEIECQLTKYWDIKEAAVIASEEANGKGLCAFLVMDTELRPSEIKKFISKVLPEYMVPALYIRLDKMPLTPNGKIDRKSLEKIDISFSKVHDKDYNPAENQTEDELIRIWKDIFGVQRIGVNDSFFDLGGHSINATTLMVNIHKTFDIKIPLKEIFALKTVRKIANYIKSSEKIAYTSIKHLENKEYYSASSAQRRLFALEQYQDMGIMYNMPGITLIEGKLDVDQLEKTFKQLVSRHESLRTSLDMVGGQIVQKIHEEVDFEIDRLESSMSELDNTIKSYVRPFRLNEAPLFRVGLVGLNEDAHALIVDMHHIISDAPSITILIRDFIDIYERKELPELWLHYKEYSAWEEELVKSGAMKKQEEYWLKVFHDQIHHLNLPTDYSRSGIQSQEGDLIKCCLEAEVITKLKKIAAKNEATLFMALMAVFNILLSKYAGVEDVIVATGTGVRNHSDFENTMGIFVNTLAIRSFPNAGKTFAEFLREVRLSTLQAYENGDYPFQDLVSKLNIKREPGRMPLNDAVFVFHNTSKPSMQMDNLKLTPYDVNLKISRSDLCLYAEEKDGKVDFCLEFCTQIFKLETVRKFSSDLIKIACTVASNEEIEIKDIDLLDAKYKQEILKSIQFESDAVECDFDI